jgi:hypothetical protein
MRKTYFKERFNVLSLGKNSEIHTTEFGVASLNSYYLHSISIVWKFVISMKIGFLFYFQKIGFLSYFHIVIRVLKRKFQ